MFIYETEFDFFNARWVPAYLSTGQVLVNGQRLDTDSVTLLPFDIAAIKEISRKSGSRLMNAPVPIKLVVN